MIVVSSFSHAAEAYETYRPSRVISILDASDGPPPAFKGLASENHVLLGDDCSKAGEPCAAGKQRCEKLIALARDWDRKEPILIHCHQGVARSMAAAYIILCAVEDGRSEKEIAARLRQAAPHADPNLLLISEADELLGRQDRMVEAVLDLCPCSGAVVSPIVALPLAA